jgi:hypothetical protein
MRRVSNHEAILRDAALRAAPQDEVSIANAPPALFFDGAGHASILFPSPKGEWSAGRRQGLGESPFGEPLRSGPPRAVRRRAHPLRSGCCASRRSIRGAHCRGAGPGPLAARVMTARRPPTGLSDYIPNIELVNKDLSGTASYSTKGPSPSPRSLAYLISANRR